MSARQSAPWRFTTAPPFKYRVKGGAKVVALYDQCHLAWRAGLVDSWYYGRRSPDDPTIVWEVNGIEQSPDQVSASIAWTCVQNGVQSFGWGAWWCGYRAVTVTYTDGRVVTERFDGTAVVLEERAA